MIQALVVLLFYELINKDDFTFKEDYNLGYKRIEVRSKKADSHLGHVLMMDLVQKGLGIVSTQPH